MSSTKFGGPNITAHMIERQVRLWQSRLQASRATPHEKPESVYRFLTLTSDEGSLGDEIARELSNRLGWQVFDKQIVNYIAENSHVRESLVLQLDQRSQGLIQDTIMRLLRMPEYGSFGMEEYHEALVKTLALLATQGNAILMGRGANFALRGEATGLHVRVTASLRVRVERLSQKWNFPPDPVRRCTEAGDLNRRAFIRHHFKQDLDNLQYYDLVFNTDHVSVHKVVDSILAVIGISSLADTDVLKSHPVSRAATG